MTVYDSLGTAHVATVYFRRPYDATSQTSTWDWDAVPQNGDAITSGNRDIRAHDVQCQRRAHRPGAMPSR